MRKPFFKKSHKSWYVHHQGRMHKLGAQREEAFRAYHELMVPLLRTATTSPRSPMPAWIGISGIALSEPTTGIGISCPHSSALSACGCGLAASGRFMSQRGSTRSAHGTLRRGITACGQ